jgi:metallo-beta-lactamase family protein
MKYVPTNKNGHSIATIGFHATNAFEAFFASIPPPPPKMPPKAFLSGVARYDTYGALVQDGRQGAYMCMNAPQNTSSTDIRSILGPLLDDPAFTAAPVAPKPEFRPRVTPIAKPWETSDSPLFYKPYGACGTVTGSVHFLYVAAHDQYVVVDCGALQGESEGQGLYDPLAFPVSPAKVFALVITHAHHDHIGQLQKWLEAGFTGKIYCTQATAKLMAVRMNLELDEPLAADADEDDRLANLHGRMNCPDASSDYAFGTYFPIEGLEGITMSFMPTAHLLGAVSVQIRADVPGRPKAEIHFSGDVGPLTDAATHLGLAAARQPWEAMSPTVVLESTYGDRPDRAPECLDGQARFKALAIAITNANARGPGASLVIPAFTLGRTTDVLSDILYVLLTMWDELCILPEDGVPQISVCSRLAGNFARIVGESLLIAGPDGQPRWRNPHSALAGLIGPETVATLFDPDAECDERFDAAFRLHYVKEPVLSGGLSIIIAGSGTTTEGTIIQIISDFATDELSTLLLTGYCPEESPAAQLRELAAKSLEERASMKLSFPKKKSGKPMFADVPGDEVRMNVEDLSPYYSGHADAKALVEYIHGSKPKDSDVDVILVHGSDPARETLAVRLKQPNAVGARPVRNVYCPSPVSPWYDLAYRRWARQDCGELRSSECFLSYGKEGKVRNAQSVAMMVRNKLEWRFRMTSTTATPDADGVWGFVATEGEARHEVKVRPMADGFVRLEVSSRMGVCDVQADIAQRLFPWGFIMGCLVPGAEAEGYKPIRKAEEVEALLARIRDTSRKHPIFLMGKPRGNKEHARFFAKRWVLGSGEVCQVAWEGRERLAEHGVEMGASIGLMYGCDPLEAPTMLFATQPQDQAHEIIAELNKADDHNRRACAAPAAQSWAA